VFIFRSSLCHEMFKCQYIHSLFIQLSTPNYCFSKEFCKNQSSSYIAMANSFLVSVSAFIEPRLTNLKIIKKFDRSNLFCMTFIRKSPNQVNVSNVEVDIDLTSERKFSPDGRVAGCVRIQDVWNGQVIGNWPVS